MKQETPSQLGVIIVFAIYSILYEAIIWGLFGWAVFFANRSPWWIFAAMLMSASQLKPHHFGIKTEESE